MKKFRVEILTKGGFDIEVSKIDLKDIDIDNLSYDEAYDLLYDSEYIQNCGLGDEWNGHFSLTVYDENENVIYESDDFQNFTFISSEDGIMENELLKPHLSTLVECWNKEDNYIEPGNYIAGVHEMKWQEFSFVVEDESFDPEKLFFISNKESEGLPFDYMSDPGHIFYDNHFVKVEYCNDSEDEYGTTFYIVKRENGCFEYLCGIGD